MIPHKGPHRSEYKRYILRQLRAAAADAAKETDPILREERFLRNCERVREILKNDPTMVRYNYWRC